MTALDSSLSMLAAEGVKFSQIPVKQREIAKYMSDTLDDEWKQRRGMEVVDCGVPVLSMHSPYELTSKFDVYNAFKAYRSFLK